MSKITMYDVTEQDRQDLLKLENSNELKLIEGRLNEENIEPETEVLSVFVSSPVPKKIMEKMPKLKIIATRSTGFNHIDMDYVEKNNIIVSTVPTYGEHTVAEYTFALLLALTRKLLDATEQVEHGELNANTVHGTDLHGKTLGVVGCGRIGRNVARLGKAFGMSVVGFDPFPNEEEAKKIGMEYKSLDELLKVSDVVSLHAPCTAENKHLMNEAAFEKMKRGSYLVNTARGELVDTMALISALQYGHVAGAAIDVVEDEKLMDLDEEELILRKGRIPRASLEHAVAIDVLQKMFNVIITGHNAFNTVEAIQRINQTTVENIEAYISGKPQNEAKT